MYMSVRGKRRGGFSETDTGRTSPGDVSTHAGTKEGNPEGRGHQSPRSLDSYHSGPRGPGSPEAHPGADLRSRFPIGVVWIPTAADSSRSGASRGQSDHGREDAHHRS